MFRLLLGLIAGVYADQHYRLPNVDDSIAYLQNALTEYEITATSSSKRPEKDN